MPKVAAVAFAMLVTAVPRAAAGQSPVSPDSERVTTAVIAPTVVGLIPFSIGVVTGSSLSHAPATSLLGGLQARMAGVRVIQPSGDPSVAPAFQLRGATGVLGAQSPLIIVDGTIVRGTLADLSPEDIDRIEIAKGPAASAIYGSDAAAGVIQVFTKRGADLPEAAWRVTVRNEVGQSAVRGRVPGAGAHQFEIVTGPDGTIDFARGANGSRILKADRIADNPYPQYFEHESEVFTPGRSYTNYISIAGRRGSTNLAASLQNTRSEGAVFGVTGFGRRNLRLNLDQGIGSRLDIALSGLYGWSDNDSPREGPGGPLFALRFVEPNVDLRAPNPDGTPYRAVIPDRIANASNPLYNLANERVNEERHRLVAGGTVRWSPLDWLSAETYYNRDKASSDAADLFPAGYKNALTGEPFGGFLNTLGADARSSTTGAAVSAAWKLRGIAGTTRVGYAYESQSRIDSSGAGRPPDQRSLTKTSLALNVKSWHAATILTLRDRYVADVAVRRDELSILAPSVRKPTFYRAAGAWRADRDFRIGFLDELRFHAAYGVAGLRPELSLPFASLSAGTPETAIRLPKSGELELGVNLTTRGGRFAAEYAYSRKRTKDMIDVRVLSTTIGFAEQPVNAGSLQATTHEMTVSYQVLAKREAAWSLTLTGDRTRQRITEYPFPVRFLDGGPNAPAIYLMGAGHELGQMYGSRFVRTIAELYDEPAVKALSGPGQTFDPANYVVNEQGYVVLRSAWRCGEDHVYRGTTAPCSTPERPIFYNSGGCVAGGNCTPALVPIGNSTPDFTVGLQTELRYKRLTIAGLVDWNEGGDVYNGSRQWPFLEQRDLVFDQRGKPELEKKSTLYYQSFYNNLNPQAFFVESGTFVKLRELSVSVALGPDQLRSLGLGGLGLVRVGVIGRNLLTLTRYSGYDPEVSAPVGNPFVNRVDWFGYPHYRTITGSVEIAF